jgi:glucan phosphorylase
MLPRIYEILREINERLCKKLFEAYRANGTASRNGRLSYGHIHMANLCVATCFSATAYPRSIPDHPQGAVRDYGKLSPDKFST